MNAVADAHGLLVAYPSQTGGDNASACWNWFRPGDQLRNSGEPSIIAGITQEIVADFGLHRSCTFVAGLSAGGAMAVIMGETYPDLYAAVGVYSGLAYGSASDVISAFAAMRGDPGVLQRGHSRAMADRVGQPRIIVFHGSADRTVHPSNAERIVGDIIVNDASCTRRSAIDGIAGGRTYKKTVVESMSGVPVIECWLLHGGGHAWSGGQSEGSYTDSEGPDASREMVRFFLHESG